MFVSACQRRRPLPLLCAMFQAQFTDIAVSLASGQKPLTVLLQQGGQLKTCSAV